MKWFAASVGVLAFVALCYTTADPDLWGHVRFGLDILRTWSLPDVDPYSFTQDRALVNHEWLSEVVMAAGYRLGGASGLIALKGILASAVFLVVWQGLRGIRTGVKIATLAVVWFGTVHMTSSVRPQLWSFLAFALTCRLLLAQPSRRLWWLPVMFTLWANLHGAWFVGLAVLSVWTAARLAHTGLSRENRTLVWVTAACCLATLLTPYGVRLWALFFETIRPTRDISDWQPLWSTHPFNWLPWLIAVAGAVAAVRHPLRNWAPTFVVLGVLACGAVRVLRVESLFVVSAAILLAPWLRAWWPAPSGEELARRHERWSPGVKSVVAAAVWLSALPLATAAWTARATMTCIAVRNTAIPDPRSRSWLDSASEGRLVTIFNWGQYAIWHFGPRLRVSIDGRRENIYSDQVLSVNNDVAAGTERGFEALSQWRPDYVWLPSSSGRTRAWLEDHGYRIEFADALSFVAVRSDKPTLNPSAPAPHDGRQARCFPD